MYRVRPSSSDSAAPEPDHDSVSEPHPRLSRGLVRNALFNLFGWAVPLALALVAVPILVSRMGVEAYGVYSLVSVLAGYAAIVSTPAAQGGVRFIADAYARRDWAQLRGAIAATLALSVALTAIGSVALFIAAGWLSRLFGVPVTLAGTATTAIRIGALALLINCVGQALGGVLAAVRRFELLNLLMILSRVASTGAVIMALTLGAGLIGAIGTQTAISALALAVQAAVVGAVISRLSPLRAWSFTKVDLRQLGKFSSMLFGGSFGSIIGLQIDRGLVGVLHGAAAVGYYSVPVRLTDAGLDLLGSLGQVLYPLSSEARATGRLAELRGLYMRGTRLLVWIGALMAATLVAGSQDLLNAWVGPLVADQAWVALCMLAATFLWRAPSTLAHRVAIGLGRADVSLWVSYGTLISVGVPVLALTPSLGIEGAALGVMVGTVPITLVYDLFVQRRLLFQPSWSASLALYWKPPLAAAAGVLVAWAIPLAAGWLRLGLRIGLACVIVLLAAAVLERSLFADLRGIARRALRSRWIEGHVA